MHQEYSCAVLIGRFQPFHKTHEHLIEHGLTLAKKVLILIGSAHAARTPKNPFTFEERKAMILAHFQAVRPEDAQRIFVEPLRDYFYSDDMWLAQVQAACSKHIEEGDESVALLGTFKDSSSYYLNLFPQWDSVHTSFRKNFMDPKGATRNSTDVREKLFDVTLGRVWGDKALEGIPTILLGEQAAQDLYFAETLPESVRSFLDEFKKTQEYGRLVEEFLSNRAYRASWENAPFAPTFTTADAVVTCSGHVLVIKRGGNLGKGLLALPGGFVRENERIRDAAVRELKEETRIRIPTAVLKRSIGRNAVFDYPGRSERGRTITHAFHIKLEGKLPEVKSSGADDAVGAFWMPFVEVMRRGEEFFEDHIHIINAFITNS